MGFNTAAFLLNDLMYDLEKSPHAVTYGLTHPPLSNDPVDQDLWWESVRITARNHNEPVPPRQALEVQGTFHADFTQFYRAGQNCMVNLKVLRYGKNKQGKKTVTLELPDWA